MKRIRIAIAAIVCVALSGAAPALATTPKASAAPSAATPPLTLPVPTTHGVARAQIFDRSVPAKSVYQGRVTFTWTATSPVQPAPVVGSSYITAYRNAPLRQYTYEWFQANHPTWIEYTADRVTPAWEFGNHIYTPLDVGNPEVRQWMFDNMIAPPIAAGYKVIAVDNVSMRNDYKMSGHYDANGQWVQQFTADPNDPAYYRYNLDWLRYLRGGLHAQGVSAAMNISLNVALHDEYHDASPKLLAATAAAISLSDIWLNEQGFTLHRPENVTDGEWAATFAMARLFAASKPLVFTDKLTTATWQEADPAQRQWSVANYFLFREKPTMHALVGSAEYGYFTEIPEMNADLGTWTEGPHRLRSGVWIRNYQQGLTVVNPSSTRPATLTLPSGVFTDLHGVTYSGAITVAPTTGLVLTRG